MDTTTTEEARITVNGAPITQTQINEEVQHHPSENLPSAKQDAMQALVIRELLLQEARQKKIHGETEETTIETLLEKEIEIPEPDKKTCKRYYEQNKKHFQTSPLFEISHILFKAGETAQKKAEDILLKIKKTPECFADMAKKHSACTSAADGGFMGQVSKGQTTEDFESALFQMKKEEISTTPVETQFGFHIIKVHECSTGERLPLEAVEKWIRDYLRQSSWQRAVNHYIQILIQKAEINGLTLNAAETPLMQ